MNEMIDKNIAGNTEMIAVAEENMELDATIDRLKHTLNTSKIVSIILGVVIVIVIVARLFI